MPAVLFPLTADQLAERKVELIRQLRASVIAGLAKSSSAEAAVRVAREIRTINILLEMRKVAADAS